MGDILFLRRMEEPDLAIVCEIEDLSFPNPWKESIFRGEIHNEPISFPFVIVHRFQNRIIGYIVFWHVSEEVHINNIAIHPDFRRQGIAESVLRNVLDQLQKKGASFVTLEVRPSNAAAISLYEKLEFRPLCVRKDYYRTPREDALILGKYLI